LTALQELAERLLDCLLARQSQSRPVADPQLSPQNRPMVITSKPANETTSETEVFYSFLSKQINKRFDRMIAKG
jgi:hypothetical protein